MSKIILPCHTSSWRPFNFQNKSTELNRSVRVKMDPNILFVYQYGFRKIPQRKARYFRHFINIVAITDGKDIVRFHIKIKYTNPKGSSRVTSQGPNAILVCWIALWVIWRSQVDWRSRTCHDYCIWITDVIVWNEIYLVLLKNNNN